MKTKLGSQYSPDLLEIVGERHRSVSMIIASQLPVTSWHDVRGIRMSLNDFGILLELDISKKNIQKGKQP